MNPDREVGEEIVVEDRIVQCVKHRSRRVSFQLDKYGDVAVQVFEENYYPSYEDFIVHNKMKLTFNNSQYKEGRLDEIKNQLTKKTKEEIKGWLSPQTNKNAEIHRAGLVLRDGTFQPWFFGKITRRESEMYLKGQKSGTFLVRLSEKRACYSLSVQFEENGLLFSHSSHTDNNNNINNNVNNNNNHITSTNLSSSSSSSSSCRHFLILPPDKDADYYKLLGSYQSFDSLTTLIHHHGHARITKSGELLLHSCPKPLNFTLIF